MKKVSIAMRGTRRTGVPLFLAPVWGAIALLAATPAAAQSFDELAVRLLEHPEVVVLREQAQAQRELSSAAGALPDPVIALGVNNVPVSDPSFDQFLPSNKAIEFRQRIPNGRLRDAVASSANASALADSLQAAHRLSALRAELAATLAAKASVRERIALVSQRRETLDELGDVVASEIEAGRAVIFRVAEVDIARAETARELATLNGELARLDAALVALVGIAADAPPPPLEPPDWRADAEGFFAVQLAQAGIGVANAGLDEAEAGYRPEWGFNVMYQQREAGADGADFPGDDWFSASLSFTVPLWSRSSQAPRVRAASARQRAAHSRLEAVTREALARFASLEAAATAADESARMLGDTRSAVEAQVRSLTVNYEGGLGTYPPVLEARIAGLELKSQLAVERSRYLSVLAQAHGMQVSP